MKSEEEYIDYSCSTPLERLSRDVETLLRSWHIVEGSDRHVSFHQNQNQNNNQNNNQRQNQTQSNKSTTTTTTTTTTDIFQSSSKTGIPLL